MTMNRRRFLQVSGASITAAFFAACDSQGPEHAQRILTMAEHANEHVERALFRHTSMDRAAAGARAAGSAFPQYYVSDSVPVWDEAARGPWTLEVGGLVERPVRLDLDALTRLPRVSQRVNHFCVEGWTAVAEWTGTRVAELAKLVGVKPEAQYVDFASFDDDYHESWDLASALHPQTLIAYGMDGRMLGPGHGAPARVHSPVKLGYKNTKYLVRVQFMAQRNGGYWSDQGYEWYGGT
ncbi:MAG TPA: molybdopterin-dependent oxidoreductase [Gemmatimonadaceae bacterium]|nr:molybdopterin-dependent oxidoreductase [Gemmatimonadaceae bacterium]